jgi:NADH-quinone oxidoreductase subunit N
VRGVAIYLAIYVFMNVGTFACILSMRQDGRMVEGIADLKGLGRTDPLMAAALAIFMFSMAGIPPLAGFFGKLFVFMAAIDAGLYSLAVIGVLASVVGAFYYIRIVKLIYFDDPEEAFDRPIAREVGVILLGSSLIILCFWALPGTIIDGATAAAASLAGS